MRRYLAAVSLVWVMGTASAQGIGSCAEAARKAGGSAAAASDPLHAAFHGARIGDDALRAPVSGECTLLADGRKKAPGNRRAAAAGNGKPRDPDYYRFDMSQHGKQMSAEDFDRWMKERGIRVAKGPQPKPVARTERKRRR